MPALRPRKISRLGWRPDLPDHNDFLFVAQPEKVAAIPAKVDLRPQCSPVYQQGNLGSCTANALGAAFEFVVAKQGGAAVTPSRLFIYYNERVIEGTVEQDAGAMLRDGAKVMAKLGAPPETSWPYVESEFATQPPEAVYNEGLSHQVMRYMRVSQTLIQMKACLAAGYPFVGGFTVYESFEGPEVASTGKMNMPGHDEKMIGGHAVKWVGYDDDLQCWLIRNSWGPEWGIDGYFLMPYAYALDPNLAADFWTFRLVETV